VILVELRCKVRGCGALLDEVASAPATDELWATLVNVHLCPRHGQGAGHGNIARWQDRQRRAGKPDDRALNGRWVSWAELRPAVETARRTGRTQVHAW
jgi:hypothetical protein